VNLYAGASLKRNVTLSGPTNPSTGRLAPVDLTGCIASFGFASVGGNGQKITDTTNMGLGYITVPAPTSGTVVINIPESITSGLLPGPYNLVIKIVWTDGSADAWLTEVVTVLQGVAP
jgi:hypothetical protein